MATKAASEFKSARVRPEKYDIREAACPLSHPKLPKASYDVFINRRGIDLKHSLASCICHTLHMIGVRAFLDNEELELGDSIPTEIEDAMRSASIYIAIISENYAKSPLCLEELSFMLKIGAPIIPVFYHVRPSDLQWVTEGTFSKYEKNNRYKSERIDEWKMALHDVSFRSGCEHKDNDDEGMLLKRIVIWVLERMEKVPLDQVAKQRVALDAAVRNFETAALITPSLPLLPSPYELQRSIKRPWSDRPFSRLNSSPMATASSSRGRTEENEISKPFEEITVSPTSSSTRPKVSYGVFISHRGIDVKNTLASSIYHALDLIGVRAYLLDIEDKLELGDSIQIQIEDAMRSALIYIAIFSEHYAQSACCLAELSFMLNTGAPIIPVFYHVQRSDLRWVTEGKGIYAAAFCKHEKNRRYKSERIEEWKMALHNVSFRSGFEVKDNDDEGMLLKRIMNHVLERMEKVRLEEAKHTVGLDAIVRDFETALLESTCSHQKVQIVGIVGIGGCGKTTLAKELYNKKCSMMCASSFLFDVRHAASKNALLNLQKKLVGDLLPNSLVKDLPFCTINDGKIIVASRLRSVRGLIVLDDVDHPDQLDALLPGKGKENFASGSLIIVTSRELGILTSWGISSIYQMKGLDRHHATQLLCWYAFLPRSPLEGFQGLVEKFLDVCNGLPLLLKVLGRQLYRQPKMYWAYLLKRISKLFPKDIKEMLKVTYDALNKEDKNIFLDIACFFIGEKQSLAVAVWDGSGWNGVHSWETLVHKCLVELDEKNCIRMHDHLRDLGKEIAINQLPYRVWIPKQILTKDRKRIRGIMAATAQFVACSAHEEFPTCSSHYQPSFEISRTLKLFPASSLGLELLVVREADFTEEYGPLSKDLVWLRWFDFNHTNLPAWLSLKNLRVLELYGALSLKELWEDDENPPLQLRELIISSAWGSSFERFPSSIGDLKYLRKIALIGYLGDEFRIKGLPEEFCLLQSLEHLELRYCKALSSLPTRFGELKNLRHLDLCSCQSLRMLPLSFKQITGLQYLDLSGCRKLALAIDILENILNLEKLSLSGCFKLQELPRHITNQVFLRQLHLQDTNLQDVPDNINQLKYLEVLTIGSPLLTSLPDSVGDLSSLKSLSIIDCIDLKSFPASLKYLELLECLCIKSSGVSSLPEGFRQFPNLTTLEISDCPIRFLSFGLWIFSSLEKLNLSQTLVTTISISEVCCPILKFLQLRENHFLVEIETLPESVEIIELSYCEMLNDIRGIHGLANLRILEISGCPLVGSVPDAF